MRRELPKANSRNPIFIGFTTGALHAPRVAEGKLKEPDFHWVHDRRIACAESCRRQTQGTRFSLGSRPAHYMRRGFELRSNPSKQSGHNRRITCAEGLSSAQTQATDFHWVHDRRITCAEGLSSAQTQATEFHSVAVQPAVECRCLSAFGSPARIRRPYGTRVTSLRAASFRT